MWKKNDKILCICTFKVILDLVDKGQGNSHERCALKPTETNLVRTKCIKHQYSVVQRHAHRDVSMPVLICTGQVGTFFDRKMCVVIFFSLCMSLLSSFYFLCRLKINHIMGLQMYAFILEHSVVMNNYYNKFGNFLGRRHVSIFPKNF
jgi:hypothetical protein